ncbi:hypothetical protein KHA80_22070 [Anaerobacillus sp. HL2]|nr:hypothetical protein KHA80_22070 [Anaerobacillus sp. HL2]
MDTIETGGALGVLMAQNVLSFGNADDAIRALEEVRKATPLGRIVGSGAEVIGKIYGTTHVPTVKVKQCLLMTLVQLKV